MFRSDRLTSSEKDVLIEWFMYRMDMPMRHKLMAELPQIYLAVVHPRQSTLDAVLAAVSATARERFPSVNPPD